MQPQELFNATVTHLLTQNQQSVEINTSDGFAVCRYRGPDGLMCAFGPMIRDDEYDKEMETKSVAYIFEMCPAIKHRVGEENESLAVDMQRMHDHKQPEAWAEALREVAVDHKLDATIIDEVLAKRKEVV